MTHFRETLRRAFPALASSEWPFEVWCSLPIGIMMVIGCILGFIDIFYPQFRPLW